MVFAAEHEPEIDVVRPHRREQDAVETLPDQVLPDLEARLGARDPERLGGTSSVACRAAVPGAAAGAGGQNRQNRREKQWVSDHRVTSRFGSGAVPRSGRQRHRTRPRRQMGWDDVSLGSQDRKTTSRHYQEHMAIGCHHDTTDESSCPQRLPDCHLLSRVPKRSNNKSASAGWLCTLQIQSLRWPSHFNWILPRNRPLAAQPTAGESPAARIPIQSVFFPGRG